MRCRKIAEGAQRFMGEQREMNLFVDDTQGLCFWCFTYLLNFVVIAALTNSFIVAAAQTQLSPQQPPQTESDFSIPPERHSRIKSVEEEFIPAHGPSSPLWRWQSLKSPSLSSK